MDIYSRPTSRGLVVVAGGPLSFFWPSLDMKCLWNTCVVTYDFVALTFFYPQASPGGFLEMANWPKEESLDNCGRMGEGLLLIPSCF